MKLNCVGWRRRISEGEQHRKTNKRGENGIFLTEFKNSRRQIIEHDRMEYCCPYPDPKHLNGKHVSGLVNARRVQRISPNIQKKLKIISKYFRS